MLDESDRRILAKACKICLHEKCEHVLIKNDKAQCKVCGEWTKVKWDENGFYFPNPTFSTADDWEMVRVKVILPNILLFESIIYDNGIQWWLQKTSHELCQTTVDIIKSRPDLFPWVVEMKGVKE